MPVSRYPKTEKCTIKGKQASQKMTVYEVRKRRFTMPVQNGILASYYNIFNILYYLSYEIYKA